MATSPSLAEYVDYRSNEITKSKTTGGWKSAILILGMEFAEGLAFLGISMNLMNYLTGPLHISTAAAAENLNLFSGVSFMLPILGSFLADTYLGHYRTILISGILELMALVLMSLSAGLPCLHPTNCEETREMGGGYSDPSIVQTWFFFFSLYLLALGHGGLRPSVQGFGATQFDENDPEEKKSRSSFFNWCYFGTVAGGIAGISLIGWMEERVGWGIGFTIPCTSVAIALSIFLMGTQSYRFGLEKQSKVLTGLLKGLVALALDRKRWWFKVSSSSSESEESKLPLVSGVDEIALLQNCSESIVERWECKPSKDEASVERAKAVLRLLPIWASCLLFSVIFAQRTTFFIKQGTTMNRTIFSGFLIPAATLQSLIGLSILVIVPIYDRILVPAIRRLTGISTGITMLQRLGTGLFLSAVCMAVAALVETRRLRVAREAGLVDDPMVMVPMSAWWLLPQILLLDVSGMFALVGMLEFFYDQVPGELQSVGLSLFFTVNGVGNFLSSFLVLVVDKLSKEIWGANWFSDNLNKAHVDYFYWILAGLSLLDVGAFMILAKRYVYKNESVAQGSLKH